MYKGEKNDIETKQGRKMQDVGEGQAREKVTWYLTFDTEPRVYLRKVFHA